MNDMIAKEKNKPIVVVTLSLFLLLMSFYSHAQKGYEKGFVVLNSKDTLYGFIKDRKEQPFGRLYKKIKFKSKRRNTKYRPDQIFSYHKGGSIFESIWISNTGGFLNQNFMTRPGIGELYFLKVVHKGFLSYYFWEHEDADSGYFESVGYFRKEGGAALVRVSQGIFGLKRKSLATFFSDCPALAMKIRNKTINDPIAIVQFYNNWKNNQGKI